MSRFQLFSRTVTSPPPESGAALGTEPAQTALPFAVRLAIIGTFLILLVGAIYYARGFFLPLVLATLVTLTFAPLVRYLGRHGVPAVVSAVMLVVVLGGGLATATVFLSEPVSRMIVNAPSAVIQVRERFSFLRKPFATLNDATRELNAMTDITNGVEKPQQVVVMQSGLFAWAAGTAAGIGTTLGVTLILSLFLLASGDTLRAKLIRISPHLREKKRSLRVLRDIENEVSRYLLTITAINAGLGLAVGLVMAALGMPNPILWGIGAALLNFVPYLGGLVGMVLAIAVASITFPTLLAAALPPLAYLGLQIIEGNFVTPTIVGRRLELNTVAILIFLALATWMWGIVGTVIAVPVLVVIKVFSHNFPNLAGLGEFLSAESATVEDSEREHEVAPSGP